MLGSSRFRAISTRIGLERDWYLILLAVVIGLVMGFAVLGFIMPITWGEAQLAKLDQSGPTWMNWLVLALPIGGAFLTGVVLLILPIRLRGHGVSICMYSVSREQARLPFRLLIRQGLGSTLTIGSGGSAGPVGGLAGLPALVVWGLGACAGRIG